MASFVTLTNMASAISVDTQAKELVNTEPNLPITSIDRQEFQRKVRADTFGTPTLNQVLASIIEDARGPCLGGIRCTLAFTNNGELTLEDRFKQLQLDASRVGDYALSITGNPNKARILAIIENKDDNNFYVHYTLNKFIALKETEMTDRGLASEVIISKRAIIRDLGKFTAVAMNPHAVESMSIIEEGISALDRFTGLF